MRALCWLIVLLLLLSLVCGFRLPPARKSHRVSPRAQPVTSSSKHAPLPVSIFIASAAPFALSAARSSPWYVWSLLSMTSFAGVAAEKTALGSMLSSPLVTMGLSMILCNVGLLPPAHTGYRFVLNYLVPLAVPLLLLDADLFRCFRIMGSLLKAFLVGK